MKILIIGGVAGGATAAARLRRLNEKAEIIIIERGEYISFANCGLPYYIGGDITERKLLTLQTPESFKSRFNIDVRVFNEAISVDPKNKTVTIKELKSNRVYEENYDKLILATGATAVKPNIKGITSDRVFTLRNIPDMDKIKDFISNNKPSSALIVGGGNIGVEIAEALKKKGIDVTIAEMSDHLIPGLDLDMAADVHRYIRKTGVNLLLDNAIRSVEEKDGKLTICLDKGSVTADMIILSAGVRPETKIASDCGIEMSDRGYIKTNKRMCTSIQDIYAVGDAVVSENIITDDVRPSQLAGPANKQGRVAADNICGVCSEYGGSQGTSILKIFDMTAAFTGISESEAERMGISYDKTYIYSGNHASYYPDAKNMSIKALWNKDTHKIIGAQITGFDGVDKRIDVLATAMRFNADITELKNIELSYAPPYSSAKDPINMLGFVAENVIQGRVKQFFWNEVDELPRDGSVTLIDTRTVSEYSKGHIDGFKNIPLDSLRQNLDKIPIGKTVYIHCHSGLRSYIACRILSGYGYDCRNLAGGWRLYESANREKTTDEYVCTDCN